MTQLLFLFVGIVVFVTALAGITIWSPRRMSVKVGALALSALLMASSYGGFLELMGRPKPTTLEWVSQVEEATVVGVRMREGEAIYLWLELGTPSEPRSYVIPWSEEEARELQEAMEEAESNGGQVRMRQPFSNRPPTDEPMFYAQPQTALPPKPNAG